MFFRGVFCLNGKIFDEQCRLCRFLGDSPPCARTSVRNVVGVDVCTGYEAVEV